MLVLVFGKNGNLSKALVRSLSITQTPYTSLGKDDLDFRSFEEIPQHLDRINPDVIINAAAFTQVDLAESNELEAFKINAEAPKWIANWCAQNNKVLIHYSTDYVFDGTKNGAWTEEDKTNPINVYGRSKLMGEQNITTSGCKYIILRTSWIFAPAGTNFFITMLKHGANKTEMNIVNDQFGNPSYAHSIADATIQVIQKAVSLDKFPSGIYNLSNSGATTWFDFAEAIFKMARTKNIDLAVQKINPITSDQYKAPAMRPKNSQLSTNKIKKYFNIEMPHWSDKLEDCFDYYLKIK